MTFQQERTKRWQKHYFPSLPSLFNGERCQVGRAAAPGARVSSGVPLCRRLSPGWLISQMTWERLNSEHQPGGGQEQPATPAKLIESFFFLTARFPPKFPGFSLQLEEIWQIHRLHATYPCEKEDLPGAAVPRGTGKSPAAAEKTGGKTPSSNRIPTHVASVCPPPLPPWLIAPQKKQPGPRSVVRITRVLAEKNSAFANLVGATPCPPAPGSFCSGIALPPCCRVPGKGPGSITGGCGIAEGLGSLAASPPPPTRQIFV